MLSQYEENLQNERIEKDRLSKDYEDKIQALSKVRYYLHNSVNIIFRKFFFTSFLVTLLSVATQQTFLYKLVKSVSCCKHTTVFTSAIQ